MHTAYFSGHLLEGDVSAWVCVCLGVVSAQGSVYPLYPPLCQQND